MATSLRHLDAIAWVTRLAILALALATAYIHALLGGLMFMANAVGFLVLAVLMVMPLEIVSRCRWLIRAALIGFALGSIGAWLMFGARFWLAYLDKGIEIALTALLFLEMVRYDGGPLAVARRAWRLCVATLHRLTGAALVIVTLTLALLLAGCGTARPMSTAPPDAVIVSATGDQFTDMPIWVDAGVPFTIYFQITDFSQHNLRLTSWNDQASIGATEIFQGISARTLEVPALVSGDYYELTCDIHPDMQGVLEAW